MENQNINKRIAAIIENKKITPNAFATQLGFKAAVIYNILKERNKPGYDLLVKICETFNVRGNWLLTGEGLMYSSIDTFDIAYDNNNVNPATKYSINIKISSEAEFLNTAQERVKIINDLYQRLIDIRVLLYQELNIKSGFSTQAEDDLLNSLARTSINKVADENIMTYPYKNLDNNGKELYLKKTDECITLFTNTFFELFGQLYKGIVIPSNAESRKDFLTERAKLTDQWKYPHYK